MIKWKENINEPNFVKSQDLMILKSELNFQIQTDSEELLIIKTRESLLSALTEHVKANHEYE